MAMLKNSIALEFVRFVLDQNPMAKDFGAIYDAMSRTASRAAFRNLGHDELSIAGISFSLHAMDYLEKLVEEARKD
jgi:hypothetical protein